MTVRTFRRQLQDLDDFDPAWCNKPCLVRHLRARDWDIAAAEKLLRGTAIWRREAKIERIDQAVVEEGPSHACAVGSG